jgi:hypothetical protein
MHRKNLADIRHKLSIIYKHIELMHNELRYQAKTHTISKKLPKEKKIMHLLPHFFFFFLMFKTNKQKKNKDMLMEKEMTFSPSI